MKYLGPSQRAAQHRRSSGNTSIEREGHDEIGSRRRPDPECIKSNRASGAGTCMIRQKCDRTISHSMVFGRGRPGSVVQSGCVILILPNEYNSEFQNGHGRLSGFSASSLGRGSRARPDLSCCGMRTLFKPVIRTRLVRAG